MVNGFLRWIIVYEVYEIFILYFRNIFSISFMDTTYFGHIFTLYLMLDS